MAGPNKGSSSILRFLTIRVANSKGEDHPVQIGAQIPFSRIFLMCAGMGYVVSDCLQWMLSLKNKCSVSPGCHQIYGEDMLGIAKKSMQRGVNRRFWQEAPRFAKPIKVFFVLQTHKPAFKFPGTA